MLKITKNKEAYRKFISVPVVAICALMLVFPRFASAQTSTTTTNASTTDSGATELVVLQGRVILLTLELTQLLRMRAAQLPPNAELDNTMRSLSLSMIGLAQNYISVLRGYIDKA